MNHAERFKNLWWATLPGVPPSIEDGGRAYRAARAIFVEEIVSDVGDRETNSITIEFRDGSGIRFSLVKHDDGQMEIAIAIKDPRPEGGG